jgi:Kef-type K+ transport system membrane component KefB/mannitol/fructose-specific phosphotransferase system IIA component (Ntr-type)
VASPSLPFTDPVVIVALSTGIFLAVPFVAKRLRFPAVIGLIVAGAAVGPNGAGLLARDNTMVLLGTVGLLYLMLMVGLELDLPDFNRYRSRSMVFGTLSFVVPGVVGLATGLALGYSLPSSLLLASAFSSHTLLAYPSASRLGIVRNPAVTTALGGTILTEVLALVLLASVVSAAGGGIGPTFWVRLFLPFALYAALILWALPRVGRWFFRNVPSDGPAHFLFVTFALFAISYAAHWAGVEPIIGALLVGLALNRLIPEHGPLMNRIHFVGNTLFIPFFLLAVGMLVDVRALDTPAAWGFALALAAGVTLSKWAAAFAATRIFGYTRAEGWVVFGLSVPHAAGTLAIVLVGYDVGLLDQAEVNGVVLMILVTCMVGPWAVERFGREVALAEESRPHHDPGSAPRRVLIPLARPSSAEALMDLAAILRGRQSHEPLYPLIVVREGTEGAAEQVAEAEKMLSHAVVHTAGADIPVVPITRVDDNIAAGIQRAAAETRSSAVVVGWDGTRRGTQVIFGSVLDQLLEEGREMVLVARIGRPLPTTGRVVLVVPPATDRHAGFGEAARAVGLLAASVGAPVLGLAVRGDTDRMERVFAAAKPPVAATWEPVVEWAGLLPTLQERLRGDDLVVVLGARRGTLHWHPRLERLPGQLAALAADSFLVVYPPERPLAPLLEPDGIVPDHVLELHSARFEAAMAEMLGAVIQDGSTVRSLCDALVRDQREFSTEILPGVILPHVRSPQVPRPLLVLGLAPRGLRLPHLRVPARVVLLLVSPSGGAEEHLRTLAELARVLATPGGLHALIERVAPGTADELLHTPVGVIGEG